MTSLVGSMIGSLGVGSSLSEAIPSFLSPGSLSWERKLTSQVPLKTNTTETTSRGFYISAHKPHLSRNTQSSRRNPDLQIPAHAAAVSKLPTGSSCSGGPAKKVPAAQSVAQCVAGGPPLEG